MKIQNQAVIAPQHNVKSVQSDSQTTQSNNVKSIADKPNISEAGKVTQQIDSLFDKVDNIYMTHLSSEQKKELDTSYKKLDELFEKQELSPAQDKTINALFDKIDEIFTSAEKSLTPKEQETLANLDLKINDLLEVENKGFETQINEELDGLFSQREGLLTSKLSSQQKNELKGLNESLNALFDNLDSDENTQQANKLFEKIDNILQSSYNTLSEDDKNKVDQLDQNINNLFEELDQNFEDSLTYY
ncbi:hypothetical protein [Pseudoalteromonas denitrificans]|jgi:hypothetical protein|uniref:Uncharacterized protein n=1 Tax=Pseudoalteromonas denitrificans DSM 6059 TaxID=1123010 RepID=A0A1I1NR00_9GAMM|nr:hypothetical protein [Pseudoalteromonas denitrificans]SFD00059.1 hypothetical protein SAMN02745724_03147 [Pseudoalteromonas denitrificans DSM 6059]